MTIYYIDGQRKGIQGGHDMGVYKMEGGRVEPLPGFASDTNRKDPNWWWPNQLCITCKSWQWFYPSTYIYIYIFQGIGMYLALKCKGPFSFSFFFFSVKRIFCTSYFHFMPTPNSIVANPTWIKKNLFPPSL